MVEATENPNLKRLREVVTTVHMLKQLNGFDVLDQESYDKSLKSLNDKAHAIIENLIDTLVGG